MNPEAAYVRRWTWWNVLQHLMGTFILLIVLAVVVWIVGFLLLAPFGLLGTPSWRSLREGLGTLLTGALATLMTVYAATIWKRKRAFPDGVVLVLDEPGIRIGSSGQSRLPWHCVDRVTYANTGPILVISLHPDEDRPPGVTSDRITLEWPWHMSDTAWQEVEAATRTFSPDTKTETLGLSTSTSRPAREANPS
ncbi:MULTISPECIES: hypothetical protein [Actinomadura]|uniref:hypothetical protein n=1 Tax=Actinomadura TaxID=1988 RepID=UPI000420662A|nr:hypothetical protein [Actinomadura madurae]